METTKQHAWSPDVREHRATDQIQLTTDTTIFTVKTKTILSHVAATAAVEAATVEFAECSSKYVHVYALCEYRRRK